jgi:hypothetical protein
MMNAVIGDTDCLLHEPETIAGFTDLKVVLFENSPLYSIPPAINACSFLFPDENVPIDGCLSVSRPSPCMKKLSPKAGFNEIDSICLFPSPL